VVLVGLFTLGNVVVFGVVCGGSPLGLIGGWGAPLFGILWAGIFVSYKKRNRGRPGNCDHCGWKVRPAEARKCFVCGAYQRRYCAECGYDLTGNESGRCPECGEAI
jgi:hypothetical protein